MRRGSSFKRILVECADCSKSRFLYPRLGRAIPSRCRQCSLKHRKGPENGRWKGGITPSTKRLRASPEYAAWRKKVFERDRYTCIWCGNRGSLHADHILPFSTHIELRLDVSNGRTLCIDCHKKTPTYLGGAMKGRYCRRDPKTRQTACSKCGTPYQPQDFNKKTGWPRCRPCKNKCWKRRYWEKKKQSGVSL